MADDRWLEVSKSVKRLDEKISRMRLEIEDIKDMRRVDRYKFGEEEDMLRNKINRVRTKWHKQRKDYHLSQYNEAIDSAMGGEFHHLFPSKIQSEQAGLCRHLHLMEVHEKQLSRVSRQNTQIVRFMKKQIKGIQEEKTTMEFQYMNKLCITDTEINVIKENYRKLTGSDMLSKATESTLLDQEDIDDEELKEAVAYAASTESGGSWIQSMFGFGKPKPPTTSRRRTYSTDSVSLSLHSNNSRSNASESFLTSPLERDVTPTTQSMGPTTKFYNRKANMTTTMTAL